MKCEYGCENDALFELKNGKKCCSKSSNSCPENKRKNSEKTKETYRLGKRIPAKVMYSNLSEESKSRMNWNKGNYSNVEFSYGGAGNHKAALLVERGHKCEKCLLETWNDQPIPIELEHVDGDNRNNVKGNLQLLCCNCHAQTPTWRGRNINSGKVKVTDEDLLTALKDCNNIRTALQSVGLAAKGGNYERARKLLEKIAPMAKLADAADLSPASFGSVGSSPTRGTTI